MTIQRVTVYAASSRALHPDYTDAAARLGRILAENGVEILYGGGSSGLMGAMADAALAGGARVRGVIPDFLQNVEAGHQKLTSLEVVPDMHIRKARMLDKSDAVITLPGGCGTFEELFEVMTFKRLGQFLGPIVLVNTRGYYDILMKFLEQSVTERFMNEAHLKMWRIVDEPEAVPEALARADSWSHEAVRFAAVRPEREAPADRAAGPA